MKQFYDLTKLEFLNVLLFLIAVCNFFGEPFCRSRGQRISNYTSGLKNSSKIFSNSYQKSCCPECTSRHRSSSIVSGTKFSSLCAWLSSKQVRRSNSCQLNVACIPQVCPIDPSLFSLEIDDHTKMEFC